jgi:membrane fusion protein, multidrug efflux system
MGLKVWEGWVIRQSRGIGRSTPVAVSAAAVLLALLAGCNENTPQVQAPLPRVDVVTAEVIDFAPRATLTGTIAAQSHSDLSFRISGKIIERNIDVGDHVTADQVLARLDPRTQETDVESAKAGVTSAQAQLKQATSTYDRQKSLLDSGFTTRNSFDQADQSLRTAKPRLIRPTLNSPRPKTN